MNQTTSPSESKPGVQRLSVEALQAWEALDYGMFIHFGMSTFDGQELSLGDSPPTLFAPDALDVDQWVCVARDAGMKYAVLTTKHVSGFCLWPTKQTDYHVGHSSCKTDVVEAFVRACEKRGIKPGLYYCSWDNHNRFGSLNWSDTTNLAFAYTTAAYREFQARQIHELLTQYGPIVETWIDIPHLLGREGRIIQYQQIAELQPDTVIMLNHGFGDGTQVKINDAWPTDIMAIERWLPSSHRGYNKWHQISDSKAAPQPYYIPGEVCDPIGYEWFHQDNDAPRSVMELVGMRSICRARGANLLLNVPPDRSGRIPQRHIDALMKTRKQFEKLC